MKPASPPRTPAVLLALIAALVVLGAAPAVSQAAPCTPPVVNPVACENTQAGLRPEQLGGRRRRRPVDPGLRDVDERQQGRDDLLQDQVGDLELPHRHPAGWATTGGDGARLIALEPDADRAPSTQPACQTFADHRPRSTAATGPCRASWTVPSTAVSGVYIAHLVRNDTGGDSQIVVRRARRLEPLGHRPADLRRDLAGLQHLRRQQPLHSARSPARPATRRPTRPPTRSPTTGPFDTAEDDSGRSWLFTGAEYPMIRFLEAQRLRRQLHVERRRRPQPRRCCRTTRSSSRAATTSTGRPRSARTSRPRATPASTSPSSAATRCSGRRAGSRAPTAPTRRTARSSPTRTRTSPRAQDPVEWTGTWRDPRFTTPPENVTPENALTGQSFLVNSGTSRHHGARRLQQPAPVAQHRGREPDAPGQSLHARARHAGLRVGRGRRQRLPARRASSSCPRRPSAALEVFTDYGSTTTLNGTATHNLTMYRAPSGARVFGAGTVQWAWGLDDWNPDGTPPDRNMQQATVNLFADMGAQPGDAAVRT